jgi:tetratricopeptide (TPR) repeat protein
MSTRPNECSSRHIRHSWEAVREREATSGTSTCIMRGVTLLKNLIVGSCINLAYSTADKNNGSDWQEMRSIFLSGVRNGSSKQQLRRSILGLFILPLTPVPASAQQLLIDEGLALYNLEYDEAVAAFEHAIAEHPSLPGPHNHLARALILGEMLRQGVLQSAFVPDHDWLLGPSKFKPSPELQIRVLDEIAQAASICEARLKRDPADTAAIYDLGIAYSLRGNYFWLIGKPWYESLKDARAAVRLHNQVSLLDPTNLEATLAQGLQDYIVGSIGWQSKILVAAMGMRGDKQKGLGTVKAVATRGGLNKVDAQVILCAIYFRENQPAQAVSLIRDLLRRFPRNYLLKRQLLEAYSAAGNCTRSLPTLQGLVNVTDSLLPGEYDISVNGLQAHRSRYFSTILNTYNSFEQRVC